MSIVDLDDKLVALAREFEADGQTSDAQVVWDAIAQIDALENERNDALDELDEIKLALKEQIEDARQQYDKTRHLATLIETLVRQVPDDMVDRVYRALSHRPGASNHQAAYYHRGAANWQVDPVLNIPKNFLKGITAS